MEIRTALIVSLLGLIGCNEPVEDDCNGRACSSSQTTVRNSKATGDFDATGGTSSSSEPNVSGGSSASSGSLAIGGTHASDGSNSSSMTIDGAGARGNTGGDLPWLNGYTKVADAGVEVVGSVVYSIQVEMSVHVVPQEEWISFIQTHSNLFTEAQYQKLTALDSFLTRGAGADLLLDLLGLVFGNDVNYFRSNPNAEILAGTEEQKKFLAALQELHNRQLMLRGKWFGEHDSFMKAKGRAVALVTRILLPNGTFLGAVNAKLEVTNDNNGVGEQSAPGQGALGLFSSDGSPQAIQLTQEYVRVAESETSLKQGQELTLEIHKTLDCVTYERLVSFIKEHSALFSAAEYQVVTSAAAFADGTRAPELLRGILGVKLASSWGYFAGTTSLEISAYDPGDRDFVSALSTMQSQSCTLSGSHTAVGVGAFGAAPHVYVPGVSVALEGGRTLVAMGTQARVADADRQDAEVRSLNNPSPLQLISD